MRTLRLLLVLFLASSSGACVVARSRHEAVVALAHRHEGRAKEQRRRVEHLESEAARLRQSLTEAQTKLRTATRTQLVLLEKFEAREQSLLQQLSAAKAELEREYILKALLERYPGLAAVVAEKKGLTPALAAAFVEWQFAGHERGSKCKQGYTPERLPQQATALLRFRLSDSGGLSGLVVTLAPVSHPPTERCLEAFVKQLSFPLAGKGRRLEVRVSLQLRNRGRHALDGLFD